MRSCNGASCAAGELQRDETSSALPADSPTLCFLMRMGGSRARSASLVLDDSGDMYGSCGRRNLFESNCEDESLREEREPAERDETDKFSPGDFKSTKAGTPYYVAPQVL